MKSLRASIVLGLSSFLLASLAPLSAQEAGAKADVPPSVLKRYDKNKNGVLDPAEFEKWEADKAARREKAQAERAAMLAKYDTNKDGKLSEEEKVAAKLDRERERSEKATERLKERVAKEKEKAEREKAEEAAAGKEAKKPASKKKKDGKAAEAEAMMTE